MPDAAPSPQEEARRLAAQMLAKRRGAGVPVPRAVDAPAAVSPAPSAAPGLEEFASGGRSASGVPPVAARQEEAGGREASPAASADVSPAAPRRLSFLRRRRARRARAADTGPSRAEADDSRVRGTIDAPGLAPPAARARPNGLARFASALSHMGMGKERMLFIENMAMMLKAGLPLIDTIRTLQAETRSKPMRTLLQKILDAVENGSALWRAMDAQGFFSMHTIALVRIGEEAGSLAQNMEYLAAQEEKDHELRSKVKMAMLYPSIVLVIMFIIIIVLGMFVLPNLIGVLFALNVPLPLVTRIVIAFSNFFTEQGIIAVPGSVGGFVLLIILGKFTPLKIPLQWVMFKIPGIGALARQATIARFGVILGGLLQAGVPVIEAMQSLVDVTPVLGYRRFYQKLLDHLSVGDSFAKSFGLIPHSGKLLPPSVQQLVITGERSGTLSEIMLKIADIYDKKASETAQKLPVILEPILLIFIGGLVATIAFAIIVPIYSIVGNVTG